MDEAERRSQPEDKVANNPSQGRLTPDRTSSLLHSDKSSALSSHDGSGNLEETQQYSFSSPGSYVHVSQDNSPVKHGSRDIGDAAAEWCGEAKENGQTSIADDSSAIIERSTHDDTTDNDDNERSTTDASAPLPDDKGEVFSGAGTSESVLTPEKQLSRRFPVRAKIKGKVSKEEGQKSILDDLPIMPPDPDQKARRVIGLYKDHEIKLPPSPGTEEELKEAWRGAVKLAEVTRLNMVAAEEREMRAQRKFRHQKELLSKEMRSHKADAEKQKAEKEEFSDAWSAAIQQADVMSLKVVVAEEGEMKARHDHLHQKENLGREIEYYKAYAEKQKSKNEKCNEIIDTLRKEVDALENDRNDTKEKLMLNIKEWGHLSKDRQTLESTVKDLQTQRDQILQRHNKELRALRKENRELKAVCQGLELHSEKQRVEIERDMQVKMAAAKQEMEWENELFEKDKAGEQETWDSGPAAGSDTSAVCDPIATIDAAPNASMTLIHELGTVVEPVPVAIETQPYEGIDSGVQTESDLAFSASTYTIIEPVTIVAESPQLPATDRKGKKGAQPASSAIPGTRNVPEDSRVKELESRLAYLLILIMLTVVICAFIGWQAAIERSIWLAANDATVDYLWWWFKNPFTWSQSVQEHFSFQAALRYQQDLRTWG
ncbi:MAG: hypothetical protein Q9227_007348 [Pyrenula ochraceoflavens]